jgi:hypothetical protein
MKSSPRRLSLKSQLNFRFSLPTLLNHLMPSQETIIIPAGMESSLYSLGEDPTQNTVSIVTAQQYFDCCLFIRRRRNLFTESLPSNERLIWLRYSGFQTSCHSIYSVQKRPREQPAKSKEKADYINCSCLVVWHTFRNWRWMQYVLPKRRQISARNTKLRHRGKYFSWSATWQLQILQKFLLIWEHLLTLYFKTFLSSPM